MSSALAPSRGLGLEEHLPLPAEAGEVVDVAAAEEGLERAVDVGERHPLLEHLVLVHLDEELRHRGREVGGDCLELGSLPRRGDELADVLRQELHRLSPERSWSIMSAPPAVPMPGIAGGPKANIRASGNLENATLRLPDDARGRLAGFLALSPLVEGEEHGPAVAGGGVGEEVVSADHGVAADSGRLGQHLLHLLAHLAGALERGGIGELEHRQGVPLVLLGDEPGGDA